MLNYMFIFNVKDSVKKTNFKFQLTFFPQKHFNTEISFIYLTQKTLIPFLLLFYFALMFSNSDNPKIEENVLY